MFNLWGLKRVRIARTGSVSNTRRVNADDFPHEAKATGNGSEGASTLNCHFADGETLGAIEAKDGEKAGRVWNAGGIEAVKDLEREEAGWQELVES